MRHGDSPTTLRARLPLLPSDSEVLSPDLALSREDNRLTFWNASGPIFSCREDDRPSIRLAAAIFRDLNLVSATVLADALKIHRSTVHRSHRTFREEGSEGLRHRGSGPCGAHKLTEEKKVEAQRLLEENRSIRTTAKKVGLSEGAIRYALKKGWLRRPDQKESLSNEVSGEGLKGPRVRSEEDQSCSMGVAVKRNGERSLARLGLLGEAEPKFMSAEGVPDVGVLLALPALLSQGLLEVGQEVYGSLRQGFYGLRSVLLTLAFMVLLRIKTVEQINSYAPGELGMLLGLDRAPEVKTIRRKLTELGDRGLASKFAQELAERWAQEEPDTLGFLYVDGHVRPYHGRAHILPKAFVPRRRLAMPATTDYWVNDENSEPLFFVTAEANDGLLAMLENSILPQIRDLVGEERRVTMVFDREGWSPKRFEVWRKNGFDVLTYRWGSYDAWPEECFFEVNGEYEGKPVIYQLAQRSVRIAEGFWMREVRRLCDSGHQTSVMTTRQDIEILEVANRMFARWRQENFFRYMRHEFGLDYLASYAVEPADGERSVPNPERQKVKKKRKKLKARLSELEKTYGRKAAAAHTHGPLQLHEMEALHARIREVQKQCKEVEAELKQVPERVPLKTLLNEEEIVRQERERKMFIDTIKLVAYRAETSLTRLISPTFARREDEGRKFLKTVFQLPGELIPNEKEQTLTIRLHGMSNWRSNRALAELCTVLTEKGFVYPGSGLRLVFRAD